MARNILNTGWTMASLLPTLAHGFSPGASVGSQLAPAQVSGNPTGQKSALDQSATAREALTAKILGTVAPQPPKQPQPVQPVQPQPPQNDAPDKQPNQNMGVNSFSTKGFSFAPKLQLGL